MRTALGITVILPFVLLGPLRSPARADAIDVEPLRCPSGAVVNAGHEGTYCAPSTCEDDDTCARIAAGGPGRRTENGYSCVPDRGLCVTTRSFDDPRGRRADGTPAQVERRVAVAECGPDGSCPEGSACETARRCVERTESDGSLCSAAPSPRSRLPVALIVALLALGHLRRTGRRGRAA